MITKDEASLWPAITDPAKATVKQELMNAIQEEPERSICHKLCDTISELGAGILEEGGWPELMPFMFQCVQSGQARLQENALLIFSQLAQYLADAFIPYLGTLHGVLKQCICQGASSEVRTAALKATTAFISTIEAPQERDRFQDMLPDMLSTLSHSLQTGEEKTAQEALEMFIEVAETHPRFLRKQLAPVTDAMLQVAEADSLEDSTRQLAAEFLVTLAEAREKAPGMMRKLPNFSTRIFVCVTGFLLDIEDDPEWHLAEDEAQEDAGQGELFDVGQECLDRLALSMGGKTILPAASQVLPVYAQDQDWKKRHAGLIVLAQIAEGCQKEMLLQLGPIIDLCLSGARDPHPRVRWAAFQALGQLSSDLGPDLQTNQHAKVMPVMIGAMEDFQNPRVQAHAAAAIVNFSENCSSDIMPQYLDGIISKLLILLQGGKKMAQEGALTAMASVADCAQQSFVKYYDAVIPYLKSILTGATDKSHRLLRAKAMECISLVGMAVGRERFRQDAKGVMEILVSLQNSALDDDDPISSYMLQAWARLCKCLGQEFLPYMQIVMPPLLQSAQLKPDVKVLDAEEENEDEDDDEVETILLGDKKISIRTSVLEEKATACNMLCCYADELKEGFFPWIEEVAQIMVPLLKFYFHEEVRKAAVNTLPELLLAAKLAVEKGCGKDISWLKQLLDFILGSPVDKESGSGFLEALRKEPEVEITGYMLQSLQEILLAVGELLEAHQLAAIVEELRQALAKSEERRQELKERTKSEDFDEEELELLMNETEQEESVYDGVADCLGAMLKKYHTDALPFVDQLMPLVLPTLASDRSAEDRRIAICIFDDMVEYAHANGACLKYLEVFMPHLLAGCIDENADVRQCAAYGLGIAAQHLGGSVQPICQDALQRLIRVVQHQESRSKENEMATDNAISAIGKICEFQGGSMDMSQALQVWLGALPIRTDLAEALIAHEQLVRMVESQNRALLGNNNESLPRIIGVFGELVAAGEDLLSHELKQRCVAILKQIQSSMPDSINQIVAALPPESQSALKTAFA